MRCRKAESQQRAAKEPLMALRQPGCDCRRLCISRMPQPASCATANHTVARGRAGRRKPATRRLRGCSNSRQQAQYDLDVGAGVVHCVSRIGDRLRQGRRRAVSACRHTLCGPEGRCGPRRTWITASSSARFRATPSSRLSFSSGFFSSSSWKTSGSLARLLGAMLGELSSRSNGD